MRKVRAMTGGRREPLTSFPLLPLWETRTPFPAATLLDPTVTPLRRPITVAVVGAGCLHVAAMDNLGERMEVIAYKRKKVMSVTSRPLLPPLSADCLFLIWYCLPTFSSFSLCYLWLLEFLQSSNYSLVDACYTSLIPTSWPPILGIFKSKRTYTFFFWSYKNIILYEYHSLNQLFVSFWRLYISYLSMEVHFVCNCTCVVSFVGEILRNWFCFYLIYCTHIDGADLLLIAQPYNYSLL